MGGYVAMQMLRDAPSRFAALLLLDTREKADSDEGRDGRLRQAKEVAASGSTASVVDAMLPKMVFGEHDRSRVRAIMETATPAGVVAALEAMAGRPDSTDTLRNVRVPALVVVGDRDAITPPADAERMAGLIPGAELAPIANAGHMANFERPEQLNPLPAAFLDRQVIRHEHD
jgi:pimeloyl-ACP methyl ester carboxylesterase